MQDKEDVSGDTTLFGNARIEQKKFSLNDKLILHLFEPIVDGIAQVIGQHCEVVLCSLENWQHAVIKIVNGHVTGRGIGSPLTNLEVTIVHKLDESEHRDVIGFYFAKKENGTVIKSVKMIIRNPKSEPIGLLCINMNLSAPLINVISEMVPTEKSLAPVKPIRYPSTPQDLIKQSLEIVLAQLRKTKKISQLDRNKMVVTSMYDIGIFDIKGAVDAVAAEMGVSRYTIYNYIRAAKQKKEARNSQS